MPENTCRSLTLEKLETLPKSVCVGCPNAIWFTELLEKEQKEHLKAFCLLMHAVITNPMTSCDGTEVMPAQKNAS